MQGSTDPREDLSSRVYRILKNEILLVRLAPGAEIPETMLVERYGFSKAPLRSALARLRQEKLVITRKRLGNIVAPISIQDVHEVFQLRLLLEVEATRLAAGHVDASLLTRLDAEVRACLPASGGGTRTAYREANYAFHEHVVQSSRNGRLAEFVMSLIEHHERIVHFCLSLEDRDIEFHHRHDDLLSALLDGDGERAAVAAERAIRGSQKKIIETLMGNHSMPPRDGGPHDHGRPCPAGR